MVEQNTNLQLRGGCREKDYKKIYVKTKSFQILFLSLANALLFRQSFFFVSTFFLFARNICLTDLNCISLWLVKTREKRESKGES